MGDTLSTVAGGGRPDLGRMETLPLRNGHIQLGLNQCASLSLARSLQTRTHIRTRADTHTPMQIHTQTDTHTQRHTQKHSHAPHTRAQTQIHTEPWFIYGKP